MARPKIFKDPIHGQLRYEAVDLEGPFPDQDKEDQRLSWLLRKLLDTKEFQRLRHIRQNGLTNYVFHGAVHTWFEHSMGVAYLAREMFDRIVRNADLPPDPELRLATCTAALLHDVGHGPFSHALEHTFKKMGISFEHEKMTERYILEENSEINQILLEVDDSFPKRVAAFSSTEYRNGTDHWTYKVVSSQLDADRLDYLLRDSYFAGMKGHGFDLPRLLDMLTHHDAIRIAVDRRALEAVEAYLVMMDQIYRAVYFHKAVRSASVLLDCILLRAMKVAKDDPEKVFPKSPDGEVMPVFELFKNGDTINLDSYSRLGEYHFWHLGTTEI